MNQLLVVAKRPAAGHSKTRLCPPLTGEQAAALYEAFLRDVLDVLRAVQGVGRTVVYLAGDADDDAALRYFAELAPDFALARQRGDGLGERLDNLLSDALSAGAGAAVVTSSDSPNLPAAYVALAFEALAAGADVALGPSDDGGYYLIGLRRPQPRLTRDVPMSTPTVLAETLALAESLGLRVALLPPWYDVDTADELRRLRADLDADPGSAPWTRAALAAGVTG